KDIHRFKRERIEHFDFTNTRATKRISVRP
ncbi:MAG: hypothetical protein ACI8WW_002531, partial [Oceanospirillaceae bacterium]